MNKKSVCGQCSSEYLPYYLEVYTRDVVKIQQYAIGDPVVRKTLVVIIIYGIVLSTYPYYLLIAWGLIVNHVVSTLLQQHEKLVSLSRFLAITHQIIKIFVDLENEFAISSIAIVLSSTFSVVAG